jgi:hypothetical protein
VSKYIKKKYKIFNDKFSIFLNKRIFEPNLTTYTFNGNMPQKNNKKK